MTCVMTNDAAWPRVVQNEEGFTMKSSFGWAAFGLAAVLLAACRGESPPGTHPFYREMCGAMCFRVGECSDLGPGYGEACAQDCPKGNAGWECDADDPSLERCLVEIEELTCDEVVTFEYPDSCIEACTGGPIICDDGVQADRDSPECLACIECALGWPCLAESQACDNSQACQDHRQCTDGCSEGDETCFDACYEEYPTGFELRLQSAQCLICDECPSKCDAAVSPLCQ